MHNGGLPPFSTNGRNNMTDYLLSHIQQIHETINDADQTLLFLDYDGTLISFQKRPHDVHTPNQIKTVLTSLANHPKYIVFIITGRTLSNIKDLLPLPGLSYAAVHGLEIELADGNTFFWKQAKNIRNILKKIKKESHNAFQNEKKIYLEDKTYSLAFHYRLLPEQKSKETVKTFFHISKKIDSTGQLEIIHGSKVIELRPKGWDKGKAVNLLIEKTAQTKQTMTIYIGDDTTDEDAFKQIKDNGITIYVENKTKRSTAAQYYLKNPSEVYEFLQSLCDLDQTV